MKIIGTIVVLVLIIVVGIRHVYIPSGELEVSFMNVGQGDSIYIRFPDQTDVIIDASPNNTILYTLPEVMPWNDRTINYLMVSHADADHYAGFLGLYEQYDIGELWFSGTDKQDSLFDLLKKEAQQHGRIRMLKRGDVLSFGEGGYFEVLWPDQVDTIDSENERSIIGRLVYDEISFLFTGDAGYESEGKLISRNTELKSTVLKVGHHGSRYSSSPEFISRVSPEVCIISAGVDNSYRHPHDEVIGRLESAGCTIISTQEEGTIRFKTDGKTLKRVYSGSLLSPLDYAILSTVFSNLRP